MIKKISIPSNKKLDIAENQLKALCNKFRFKILQLLNDNPGTINVKGIAQELNIEHSSACDHLSILASAGFVTESVEGREAFYKIDFINLKRFEKISKILK